jgi:hypothetical protein
MALKLSRVVFKAGPGPGAGATQIDPLGSVVVLVGPNNSGKSVALREIREWTLGQDAVRNVIDELDAEVPASVDEALGLLLPFRRAGPPDGELEQEGFEYFHFPQLHEAGIASYAGDSSIRIASLERALTAPDGPSIRAILLRPLTVRLDGPTRFALSSDQPLGDVQQVPTNHLAALFLDDDTRAEFREMVHRALGKYPVIEAVGNGQIRLRLSDRAPTDADEERGLTNRAISFHAAALPLEGQGDGARAFVGLLTAVKSLPHQVLLIDEPEAFLHPPLARRLGRYLATVISQRDGTLITATHSSDFLTGCLDAGIPITVVRLTFDGNEATARMLAAGDLTELMIDPLVRSARVLSGLFHRAAVIVEGDSDRVFYDEINERLDDAGRGVSDAQFINAHSWQTIGRLMEPLRRLGVPAAGIVDLDAIVKGGEWGPLWSAMNLTPPEHQALNSHRQRCEEILRATEVDGSKPYKQVGLEAVSGDGRRVVEEFIDAIATQGLFVVPVGVLENWLPELGVEGKSSWIERVFDAMGGDPAAEGYVLPEDGGPWDFVDRIEAWVADPARRGMG